MQLELGVVPLILGDRAVEWSTVINNTDRQQQKVLIAGKFTPYLRAKQAASGVSETGHVDKTTSAS